jgi:DNA-binding IclR family transcriptional regulator
VKNGLRILRLYTMERPEWGVTEIAGSLGLNKSTASRLIGDLCKEGYLEKNSATGKYRLGLSLLTLSGVVQSTLEIAREAMDTLERLVDTLQETAHVSILENANVTYLCKVDCKHPVRLMSHVGKLNPACCTSSGKILLAELSEQEVRELYANGLPKMGPQSVETIEELLEDLRTVREQGYAVCIDEMHEDSVSIGAPIRDYTGRVIASVSIVGPRQRITAAKIPEFAKAVVEAGKEISRKLGVMEP